MEIQTTVKDLPDKIRELRISPETIVRVIIDVHAAEGSEKDARDSDKSKWAAVADRIAKASISEEAAEYIRKASRDFRKNFRFRAPPHFDWIEDED